tara:strand:+ start:371 stop:526 length:156 start_codon:yes stop_codon:yes gene_type:complete
MQKHLFFNDGNLHQAAFKTRAVIEIPDLRQKKAPALKRRLVFLYLHLITGE